jgi:DNA-binding protein HU-beta
VHKSLRADRVFVAHPRHDRARREVVDAIRSAQEEALVRRSTRPPPSWSDAETEVGMNKEALVEQVAGHTGQTKKQAMAIVDAVFASITSALRRGEKVTVVGFGTFQVRERAAREGRNPRTGAKIRIPPKKVPVFSAGKDLKAEVN